MKRKVKERINRCLGTSLILAGLAIYGVGAGGVDYNQEDRRALMQLDGIERERMITEVNTKNRLFLLGGGLVALVGATTYTLSRRDY